MAKEMDKKTGAGKSTPGEPRNGMKKGPDKGKRADKGKKVEPIPKPAEQLNKGDIITGQRFKRNKYHEYVVEAPDGRLLKLDWPETLTDEQLKQPHDVEVTWVHPKGEGYRVRFKGTEAEQKKHIEERKKPLEVGQVVDNVVLQRARKNPDEGYAVHTDGNSIFVVYPLLPDDISEKDLKAPKQIEIVEVKTTKGGKLVYTAVKAGTKDGWAAEEALRKKEPVLEENDRVSDMKLKQRSTIDAEGVATYSGEAKDGRTVIVSSSMGWVPRAGRDGVITAPVRITGLHENGLVYEGVMEQEYALRSELNRLRFVMGSYQELMNALSEEHPEGHEHAGEFVHDIPKHEGKDLRENNTVLFQAIIAELATFPEGDASSEDVAKALNTLHAAIEAFEQNTKILEAYVGIEVPDNLDERMLGHDQLMSEIQEAFDEENRYRIENNAYRDEIDEAIKELNRGKTPVKFLDYLGIDEDEVITPELAKVYKGQLQELIKKWEAEVATLEHGDVFGAVNADELSDDMVSRLRRMVESDPQLAMETVVGGDKFAEFQEKLASLKKNPVKIKTDARFRAGRDKTDPKFAEGVSFQEFSDGYADLREGDVIRNVRVTPDGFVLFDTEKTNKDRKEAYSEIRISPGGLTKKQIEQRTFDSYSFRLSMSQFATLLKNGKINLEAGSVRDEQFVSDIGGASMYDLILYINGQASGTFEPLYSWKKLRDSDPELGDRIRNIVLSRFEAYVGLPSGIADDVSISFGLQDIDNPNTFTIRVVVAGQIDEQVEISGNNAIDKPVLDAMREKLINAAEAQHEEALRDLDVDLGVLPEMRDGMRGAALLKDLVAAELGLDESQVTGAFVIDKRPDGSFTISFGAVGLPISIDKFIQLQRVKALRVLETPLEELAGARTGLEAFCRENNITPALTPGEMLMYHGPDRGPMKDGSIIYISRFFSEAAKPKAVVFMIEDDAMDKRLGTGTTERALPPEQFVALLNGTGKPRFDRMNSAGRNRIEYEEQVRAGRFVDGRTLLERLDLISDEAPMDYLCRVRLQDGRVVRIVDYSNGKEQCVYGFVEAADGTVPDGAKRVGISYATLVAQRETMRRLEGSEAIEPPKKGKEKLYEDLRAMGLDPDIGLDDKDMSDNFRWVTSTPKRGGKPGEMVVHKDTIYIEEDGVTDKVIRFTVQRHKGVMEKSHEEFLAMVRGGEIIGPAAPDEAPGATVSSGDEAEMLDLAGEHTAATSATSATEPSAAPSAERLRPAENKSIADFVAAFDADRITEIKKSVMADVGIIKLIRMGRYLNSQVEGLAKRRNELYELVGQISDARDRYAGARSDARPDLDARFVANTAAETKLVNDLEQELSHAAESVDTLGHAKELFEKRIPALVMVAQNIASEYIAIADEAEGRRGGGSGTEAAAPDDVIPRTGGTEKSTDTHAKARVDLYKALDERYGGGIGWENFRRELKHGKMVIVGADGTEFHSMSSSSVRDGEVMMFALGKSGPDAIVKLSPDDFLQALERRDYQIITREAAEAVKELHGSKSIPDRTSFGDDAEPMPEEGFTREWVEGLNEEEKKLVRELEQMGITVDSLSELSDGISFNPVHAEIDPSGGVMVLEEGDDREKEHYRGYSNRDFLLMVRTGRFGAKHPDGKTDWAFIDAWDIGDEWLRYQTDAAKALIDRVQREKGVRPEDYRTGLQTFEGRRLEVTPAGAGVRVYIEGTDDGKNVSTEEFLNSVLYDIYLKRGSGDRGTVSTDDEGDTVEIPPVSDLMTPEKKQFMERMSPHGLRSPEDLFSNIIDTSEPDLGFGPSPTWDIRFGETEGTLVLRSRYDIGHEETVTFDEFERMMEKGERVQFTLS
ncbi:MAG: hypothetical protein ABIG66_03380 [Candidatus Kerfeldbacteria bacterium]